MGYTMRPLQTKDMFAMSKILKKMKLRNEVKEVLSGLEKSKDIEAQQKELGAKLILLIAENLHSAQDEVNSFLASLVGLDAKTFDELPIEDTFKIFQLFKEQKGLVNFFKLAGQ